MGGSCIYIRQSVYEGELKGEVQNHQTEFGQLSELGQWHEDPTKRQDGIAKVFNRLTRSNNYTK